ncbi:hypothetical protein CHINAEXTREME_13285 [Halobiforma lacisalsi AJ5]|uniref:Uncharacterized protein n=2 Tax=Natronobacterium TaxID=2256 RepID=M0LJI0_NATLA|nr:MULTISPECIES: hypothetical protein [Halobiforma]APW98693.1 hypothetical protein CHINAEXTREME_13285 [Halobiforma lacisalsi AJ5]EMA32564.1 hypothetical protein C445_10622 [Halobiforma lacisalsi AJ5]SFC34467.1 hypothetical protein SAMN05444422_107110 [Halobiforma haloterrestris]
MTSDSDFDGASTGGSGATPNRRRFLALSSLGASGLAGCMDLGGETDDGAGPDSLDGDPQAATSSGETRTVTIIVQPDPDGLWEAQREISSALEDGELDREEAERELAQREQELIEAAIEDASSRIDEVGATVLDTVEREGTLLVEGEPLAMVDLLETPSISAILSESRFERAQRREEAGERPTDGIEPDDPATNESVSESESQSSDD